MTFLLPRFLVSKKRSLLLVLLFLLALMYMYWPTSPEKMVRAMFDRVCTSAEVQTVVPPLEARIRAKELSEIVADRLFVDYRSADEEFQRTTSPTEVAQLITAGFLHVRYFKVGYSRLKIISSTKDRIEASLFIVGEWRVPHDEELYQAAEDTEISVEKSEGKWKIARIQTKVR